MGELHLSLPIIANLLDSISQISFSTAVSIALVGTIRHLEEDTLSQSIQTKPLTQEHTKPLKQPEPGQEANTSSGKCVNFVEGVCRLEPVVTTQGVFPGCNATSLKDCHLNQFKM